MKTERLTIRVPEDVLQRIKDAATAEGRTVSAWVLRTLARDVGVSEIPISLGQAPRRKREAPKGPKDQTDGYMDVIAGRDPGAESADRADGPTDLSGSAEVPKCPYPCMVRHVHIR